MSTHDQIEENLEAKIKELAQTLKSNPNDYTSLFKYGAYLQANGNNSEASDAFMKLAKIGAEQLVVYEAGSKAHLDAGLYEEAVEFCKLGLQKFPENGALLLRLGAALTKKGLFEEAEEALQKLQQEAPDNAEVIASLGTFYINSGQVEKGLQILIDGNEKHPDNIPILNNIGAAYLNAKEYLIASEYFLKALRLSPENVQCLINIGSCFEKMRKPEVALQFYEEGLRLDSEDGTAMCAKASLICNYGMAQEAIDLYKRGLDSLRGNIKKDSEYLVHYSNYIFYIHYVPNFDRATIKKEIDQWQKEICSGKIEKNRSEFNNDNNKNKKLRVGLISGSFNVHPVGQMIYSALENINKDAVEFYMYCDNAPQRKDYLYEKLAKECNKVHDIFGEAPSTVLNTIRTDNVDILIEMTGHSDGGKRLPMIAERVAPVQIKWVGGLFDTTGIPQMDWLLGDSIEIPAGDEDWYSEKIYRMPDDYIVYYPPYYAPKLEDLPARKNDYITFGNLNNLAKTNSYSIEIWSRILHAVPNSKMLLKGNKMDTAFVQEHIYKSFESHGIPKDRVIIEGGELHEKFLNVYNRIDIALDPHPYTGGLTTCEALWMGVPVVTLPGETFAGRHAATHLTNADMAEWIATNEKDYIDIAVKWANDIDGLAKLRSGLRDHVSKTPLVDGPLFAKNFEVALRHMWSEWCDMKNNSDQVSAPKPKKSKKKK